MIIFTLKKRNFAIAVLLVVVLVLAIVVIGGAAAAVLTGQNAPPTITPPDEPIIAFAFSAPADAGFAESILQTLERFEVPATFFVGSVFHEENSNLIETMSDAGLQISAFSAKIYTLDSLCRHASRSNVITERVRQRVVPGDIVLFDVTSPWIADSLPMIILHLQNAGFEFVTVGELVSLTT